MRYFHIRPANLFRALSTALELTMNGMSKHHWRTAVISGEIAAQLGLDETERQRVVYAALLHDVGAVSRWDERAKLRETDVVDRGIFRHAEAGYELLRRSSHLAPLAESVRHHHDNWSGGNPSGLAGTEIPLGGRILHLADRVEIRLNDKAFILGQKAKLLAWTRENGGDIFDPELVLALMQCAQRESFWLDLANPSYCDIFFENLSAYGTVRYSLEAATEIAGIFATIIDRTSAFTATHSRSVAEVAVYLAGKLGFGPDEVAVMRIAGLLHDLGKLAVPNEILEKPGALTSEEVAIVRQHTYYTYRILDRIDEFKTIAEWAAYHHETLDGKGYPFRIQPEALSLGSRIVAVADVFVALTEDRPYREGLPAARVRSIVEGMVKNGKIDGLVAAGLFADGDAPARLVRRVQETAKK